MKWTTRLARLFVRLAAVCLGAALLMALPDSPADDVMRYKNAVVAFVAVVLMGKILFDTFFFERFPF